LLALFDRAEARDFTDVYLLAERYGRDLLFAQAAALDAGLDRRLLAGQFAKIQR
jgi:predicted nucleotidyltransferase component of viral defense system